MALYIFNQEKEFKRTMEIIDIGCHILFGYVQDSVESYFLFSISRFTPQEESSKKDIIKYLEVFICIEINTSLQLIHSNSLRLDFNDG